MRDKLVLGHALRQHLRAEQLDLGNQFTALVASRGQILLDDERRDLVLLDEIDEFVVHAWCPSLLPSTNGGPGCDQVACRGYGLGGVVISNRVADIAEPLPNLMPSKSLSEIRY
jgi:hypothetical protein